MRSVYWLLIFATINCSPSELVYMLKCYQHDPYEVRKYIIDGRPILSHTIRWEAQLVVQLEKIYFNNRPVIIQRGSYVK